MLRLHQLFFRQSALIFLSLFLLGAAAGYFLLRQMEIGTHERMLHDMVQIIEKDYEAMPSQLFADRIRQIHHDLGLRITIIDADGTVLFESDRDPQGMDNHASRPEVMKARDHEWGSSVRHSHTLDTDLLYVAHRIGGHTVRMAKSIAQINSQLFALWLKALAFFTVVMGVLLWWSSRLGGRIGKDVHSIQTALDKLLSKEYDLPQTHIECCRELSEISDQITKVAKRLAKREKQKAKYTRKLKRLTQSQNDIISAISHEFKNPVAAIVGYAQSIAQTKDMEPEIEAKFLSKIESNAQKISHMIDRLSLAIKLENKTLELDKTSFDLKEIAKNIRDTLQHKYPDRHIALDCHPAVIYADRDLIEHAVMNLAENAIKYSEDNITIYCDADKLEVRDSGIGIDEEDLQKITDKFYRADKLSWNNSLGLGLYIVQYILKLHDTKLEIESTPDEGSVFGFGLEEMTEGKV